MENGQQPSPLETQLDEKNAGASIQSLRELIDRASGKNLSVSGYEPETGAAEVLPFPFLALVGQADMKLALVLGLVNPGIGGVLLVGPRGTGKTTAVRSLVDLLPQTAHSLCYYGCMPEDIETGGLDAVCPDCARKYAMGEPLAALDRVRLIELPLNARLEDVVGGIDERAAIQERLRLRRGILALADRNLLYVDEVNLLPAEIVDAILDAAALGSFTVRRGPVSATYRSRFVLVGSMNPEEGRLRPQIMDRFGLRVFVRGLHGREQEAECLEIYRRVQAYQANPRRVIAAYAQEMALARQEIQVARDLLPQVAISDEVARCGLRMIADLGIDSLRAEITLLEAGRAYAALDGRMETRAEDLRAIAAMALRLRRSTFMDQYFADQNTEEEQIEIAINRASLS